MRGLLWRQTAFCFSARQRVELLGESDVAALAGTALCRDTVEHFKAGFDACQRAVAEKYGEM